MSVSNVSINIGNGGNYNITATVTKSGVMKVKSSILLRDLKQQEEKKMMMMMIIGLVTTMSLMTMMMTMGLGIFKI